MTLNSTTLLLTGMNLILFIQYNMNLLSVCLSVCLFVCLSVSLTVCLSERLSCLSLNCVWIFTTHFLHSYFSSFSLFSLQFYVFLPIPLQIISPLFPHCTGNTLVFKFCIAVLRFLGGFYGKMVRNPMLLLQKTATQVCICVTIWPFCVANCDAIPDKLFPVTALKKKILFSVIHVTSCIGNQKRKTKVHRRWKHF